QAAHRAVKDPGSEVSATSVDGRTFGDLGRWATLLRRHRTAEGLAPAPLGSAEGPVGGPAEGPVGGPADGQADVPSGGPADGPADASSDGPDASDRSDGSDASDGSAGGPTEQPDDGLAEHDPAEVDDPGTGAPAP
ncbi:MAG: hypothetical protein M3519_10350, partial [Actinomycetota bacterium]|nr:hypothetical protein [Actinomycetota bacterium]